MVVTWLTSLFRSAGEVMAPSLPGTSTSREALSATPTSRKRRANSSIRQTRPIAASKASRQSAHPVVPTNKSTSSDEGDEDSQVMDETSEIMDAVVHYSDAAEDEEPCSSSSLLPTPTRSLARPKPDRRRTGREMSTESYDTETSFIGSPRRKVFYTINDLHTSKPAERFRTDILSQIRAADSEYTPSTEEGLPSLRLTDRWREEWNHGVQVLLHPKNLPSFETRPCDIETHTGPTWRLPVGKYLLSKSAAYEREETHVVYAPPPLKIYQGDRLDELWLERLNREKESSLLPLLDLATLLNLMNEFEIECFKNIHKIVLASLAPPPMDVKAPCSVCRSPDGDPDSMLFCDGCNMCIHILCYGINLVPEGPFFCDSCKACGFTRHDRLKCVLCPNLHGAMHRVENSDKWVHVSCAMWNHEMTVIPTKEGRMVACGLGNIPDSRWQLKCSICDLRMGACMQCEYRGCSTAFHTTCAQRSGYCEVGEARATTTDDSLHFVAYCKRHTLLRQKEKKKKKGARGSDTIEQSDDETDERCEMVRGLERAFFLHVKFEDVAKRLSTSQLHASDVYEYWKQKRSENGGRPLIAGAQSEIEVEGVRTVINMESTQGAGDDGVIVLSASDEVKEKLTPFQSKCYNFQKYVFQKLDKGRMACDMVMKRERMKKQLVEDSHELFRHLVRVDSQPGIPVSGRVLAKIVDELQKDLTPEEMAESDVIAQQMAAWMPSSKKVKDKGKEGGLKRRAPSLVSPIATIRPSTTSPAKENGIGTGGGRGGGTMTTTDRTSSSKNNKRGRSRALSFAGAVPSPVTTTTVITPHPRASAKSLTTPASAPTRSRLRPQNPPDDLSVTTVSSIASSPPPTSSSSSKLRDRRDIKYF